MGFRRYKLALSFVLIALIILLSKAQAQTTVEEVSFTYDGTEFAFFETSPNIDQPDAQTQCTNWGGNLATITSAVEDSLLLYSIPDLGTTFTCHIGLNDINNEAEFDGNAFVWIDSSTSSYRKWGILHLMYPRNNIDFDCVRHRYKDNGVLSQGWLNDLCSAERNCYFCSKSGTSNGCDLIYNGSCYKVFEVSTPINWLDAQSSCAIWGGDLTSITTEKENNYLNTIITSSVGNCWIGLNDRDVEGTYTWIDGTTVIYTNWTSTPSDDTNSNCVQINNAGNGMWESGSCNMTLDAFLCKRDLSSDIPTVPTIFISYGVVPVRNYTSVYPAINTLSVPSAVQDITLSINIEGNWTLPDNSESANSILTILNFSSQNNGVYKFYTNNWDGVEVCAIQIDLTTSNMINGDPDTQITYNDTVFGYFTTSVIDWYSAELLCLDWGGNLATIKSAEEDSLLFYSITDITNEFTCHIGLNDIDNDAGTDGSAFVWVDGSTSSYRNFGTLNHDFPRNNTDFDCVRYRYRVSDALSQGWLNAPCSDEKNCYFCSKPGISNGCDLIYNSSCHKVFEVSTPINWLDAQSSCAIWGGDLTSITTERENNYLYTIIPDTVSNCWIGLNDRDVDGTYTWIDGTELGYTNWTSTPSDDTNSNCVQINNAGDGVWESVTCDTTLNTFLCKSNLTSDIPTVGRFGRIINGALGFEVLTGNTFFYEPQTLVCGSDGSIVVWRYSQNSDLSDGSILTETSNYIDFSWLDVDNTMQGYYQCMLSNSNSYTVGVYDRALTTVAVTGTNYTYIVGVDRTDVLLLCDPEDGGSLSMLRWSLSGMEFFNPMNLNSESSNLPSVLASFLCVRGGAVLVTSQICVEVPTISISYGVVPVRNYSSVYPDMNTLSVPSAVQDITLSINIEGRWILPDNSNSTNSILTIPNFSSQNNGVYKFYINNWDGVKVCAIQIELTTSNTINGDPDTQLTYTDTVFGYFTTSVIDWYSAELLCLDWGGNLATIKSAVEDNLLFHSITHITSKYSCHIGLNDINREARTNGSAFVWVDGSTSSYRKFGTLGNYPRATSDYDCVRYRYRNSGELSQGWLNARCEDERNCYFCSKPGLSNGCDIIYDSSCYKVFEVNTPINWLDAQSSCAIWGGDLTSITTERENSYLYIIIPDTVSNCWIGLNDRDVDGTYTWIDGTELGYTNWTSTMSDNSNSVCVQINNTREGYWYSVNCEDTSNTFVCRRPSNFSFQGDLMNLNTLIPLNYTVGSIRILYYPNDDFKESTKWTPDDVKDGDTKIYENEFPNPVEISTIFSAIGTGVHTMNAFYRMSRVTLLGSVELTIKDTVEVTIRYADETFNTSDVKNPLFPSAEEIEIQSGTKVEFSCSISNCTWNIESTNFNTITENQLTIETIKKTNEGTYSLIRKTTSGQKYLTARVYISVISSGATTSSSSITIIVFAIIPITILVCLIVVIILIIICIWKRRTLSSFPNQKLKTENDTTTKQKSSSKECINQPSDPQEHNNHAYYELKEIADTDLTYANSSPKTQVKERDSEIAYEEITEVIDPRMVPIPLDVYKIHMDKIWKNEGALLEEYESLGGKSHRYPCIYGTIEENKVKNRFKLIYPYDKSRVTLVPKSNNINSDYINASMIPGYYTKECFIAAQGPKENTMQDFWQMIVENEIVNIVMVTNLVESGRRKCEAYFSLKIGEKVVIGPYEINLDKEEVKTGYTIRKMSIDYMGRITQVKHFHFTAWPDHDVPTLYDELLLFVSKVQEGHIKTKAPILVHCSAGVGRTGTFITLYNLLTAIQQHKPINIYSIVNAMREHRPQMVQAFAQYKFIYLSVLEILLGNTFIPTQEFVETFNSYMKSEETGYISVFFQQFSELNYQCEKAFDPVCTAALEGCNSKKNPVDDVLPNDSNRIVLYSQQWGGDYINASNIEEGEIIITVHPTADTLENFYQLLYQVGPSLVVMLCSKKELQLIQQNKSQRVTYWPNSGESLQTDSFMITCEDSEKSYFIRNKLNLQHVKEQSNRLLTQIITDSWNENGEPDLKKNAIILQAMLEFRKQFPEGSIVVHCKDGAGISGVLYTVYKSIKDSTEKGFIDIFHTVKKLRNERMNSVSTLNQFLACYMLMNEYMYKIQ